MAALRALSVSWARSIRDFASHRAFAQAADPGAADSPWLGTALLLSAADFDFGVLGRDAAVVEYRAGRSRPGVLGRLAAAFEVRWDCALEVCVLEGLGVRTADILGDCIFEPLLWRPVAPETCCTFGVPGGSALRAVRHFGVSDFRGSALRAVRHLGVSGLSSSFRLVGV